jgi:EAL and modified HD-GYP domain-containing signal transduction protein
MSTLLDVFVGRQPIFNKDLGVYAYELLFRSGDQSNHAVILGGDSATAQVVLNAFMEIGLSNLVGEHKAFLNFTEGFLLRENIPLFPRAQLVIEVLETVKPTPAVIKAVEHLRGLGYTIALDDFFYTDEYKPLVALADIIKLIFWMWALRIWLIIFALFALRMNVCACWPKKESAQCAILILWLACSLV